MSIGDACAFLAAVYVWASGGCSWKMQLCCSFTLDALCCLVTCGLFCLQPDCFPSFISVFLFFQQFLSLYFLVSDCYSIISMILKALRFRNLKPIPINGRFSWFISMVGYKCSIFSIKQLLKCIFICNACRNKCKITIIFSVTNVILCT